MKRLFYITSVCIAGMLSSCGMSRLYLQHIDQFDQGKTTQQVAELISKEPDLSFEITPASKSGNTKKYLIEQYTIWLGDYETPYLCAYEGGKLMYWGYPWEFTRHSNPVLNEIGHAALVAYEQVH